MFDMFDCSSLLYLLQLKSDNRKIVRVIIDQDLKQIMIEFIHTHLLDFTEGNPHALDFQYFSMYLWS